MKRKKKRRKEQYIKMVFWTGIILFALGTIITGIFIGVFYHYNKIGSKLNVRPNAPIIIIESIEKRSIADSYKLGVIKTQIQKPNGTTLFEFYPMDVEQGVNVVRPDVKTLVVKEEFIMRNAEGGDGGRRQIITILPRSKLDIPVNIRSTFKGDFLAEEGQKAWLISEVGKLIPSGDEAISEFMKELVRTGLSKQALASMKEQNSKAKKLIPPVSQEIVTKPEERKQQ